MGSTARNTTKRLAAKKQLSAITIAILGLTTVQVGSNSDHAQNFFTPDASLVAVISPNDAQSWITGNADVPLPGFSGLYNDTLPAATVADSNLLTKEQPKPNNLGKVYTWGSSELDDSSLTNNFPTDEYTYNGVTYGTFVYNIAALAQAKYGDQLYDGQVVKTDEFPGLIPSIEYQVYTDGVSNYLQQTGASSPLQADVRNNPDITISDVGRYVFAKSLGDDSVYVGADAYNEIQIQFYPAQNYIGEPPALPIYIMADDGNGGLVKTVKTLKTVAPNKWAGAQYSSNDYDGKKQFAKDKRGGLVSNNGFFSDTHKIPTDKTQTAWARFDPQPYLLLDPKAPAGTVGVSTLKKDNGTYRVESDGSVSFTPDANFKDVGTYNTALDNHSRASE